MVVVVVHIHKGWKGVVGHNVLPHLLRNELVTNFTLQVTQRNGDTNVTLFIVVEMVHDSQSGMTNGILDVTIQGGRGLCVKRKVLLDGAFNNCLQILNGGKGMLTTNKSSQDRFGNRLTRG